MVKVTNERGMTEDMDFKTKVSEYLYLEVSG